jgi:hypothetical protein
MEAVICIEFWGFFLVFLNFYFEIILDFHRQAKIGQRERAFL